MKIFLIVVLIIFILSRIGGFLFRTLFWLLGARVVKQAQKAQYQARTQSKPEGVIDIDYIPEKSPKKHTTINYRGGEYVDYEEVK